MSNNPQDATRPEDVVEMSPGDEALVSEYLNLIDQHGYDHLTVQEFLNKHGSNPAIQSWTEVIKDLRATEHQTTRRKKGLRWALGLASFVFIAVLAVATYVSIRLTVTQDQLAEAQKRVEELKTELATREKTQPPVVVSRELEREIRDALLYILAEHGDLRTDPNMPPERRRVFTSDESPPKDLPGPE